MNSIEELRGKDLFMEEILEYLQEAIDGGYSKTHSIAFGWHPEKGITEMRGTNPTKVLTKMVNTDGLTRIALCMQREQEDEGYVVQMFWTSLMLQKFGYTRIYQMPLAIDNYLDLDE
jgi:hypothetical protein